MSKKCLGSWKDWKHMGDLLPFDREALLRSLRNGLFVVVLFVVARGLGLDFFSLVYSLHCIAKT